MGKSNLIKACIIGAGRAGTTIACALAGNMDKGLKVTAISSRSETSLKRAGEMLGGAAKDILFTRDNTTAAAAANCVLICTPDDKIKSISKEVFGSGKIGPKEYTAIHFSGSRPLKVLEDAKSAGAGTASVHPLKSFASIPEAIKTLPGTFFGVTAADTGTRKTAIRIVEGLQGIVIEVEDEKKPLYHAAACIASNYLVTLIEYAVFMNEKAGIKPGDSLKGLMSLIEGTIGNIKKLGTKKALTGPVARGDIGTIEEHLKNFKKYLSSEKTALYRLMGIETAEIAKHNQWISSKTAGKLEDILKEKT